VVDFGSRSEGIAPSQQSLFANPNPSDIGRSAAASSKYLGDHAWAGTMVFVKALASPELLIEIEAVAAKQD